MRTDIPKAPLSRDLWQKAMAESGVGMITYEPNAVTTMEFAKMMEVSRPTAYRILMQLVDAGKARRTFKHVAYAGGRVVTTQAYSLVP